MRYVRSFGNEETEKLKFSHEVNNVFQLGRRLAILSGFYQSGAELVGYTSIMLVIFYGTLLYLVKRSVRVIFSRSFYMRCMYLMR
jgi:ABC-type multidrug transport system fused ATPase/permease subunit